MNSAIPVALVSLGLLIFLAHLLASLFSKKMVPDVLLLILLGIILGPLTGIVKPSDFGSFGAVFTTITLVVILFEGGTSLSLDVLRESWKSTTTLAVTSFFALVTIVALISFFALGFSLLSSIILGAILGGTSSAVVIPLVKGLKLGNESKTALILESALTDVFSIVLALACIQVFLDGDVAIGITLGDVFGSFVLATAVGVLGAMLWSRALTQIRHVQNSIFTTPAFVFVIYGASELLGYNGAIAALAFGITLANVDKFTGFIAQKIMGGEGHLLNDTELVVLKELTFLLKTFFFVYIGVSIVFNNVIAILYGVLLTVSIYVVRLIVSKYCSPKSANLYDKSTISMMIPKGLAAAVLAGIPEQAGMPEGAVIKNIVYAAVLLTIIITSVLIIANNNTKGMRGFYDFFFNKLLVKESPITEQTETITD